MPESTACPAYTSGVPLEWRCVRCVTDQKEDTILDVNQSIIQIFCPEGSVLARTRLHTVLRASEAQHLKMLWCRVRSGWQIQKLYGCCKAAGEKLCRTELWHYSRRRRFQHECIGKEAEPPLEIYSCFAKARAAPRRDAWLHGTDALFAFGKAGNTLAAPVFNFALGLDSPVWSN
jgi:hypothetical protein